MELPLDSLAACPIGILCCDEHPACVWAGWVFVAWMAAMGAAGIIGLILSRHRR